MAHWPRPRRTEGTAPEDNEFLRRGIQQGRAEALAGASDVLRAMVLRRFGEGAEQRVDAWLATVSDAAAVLQTIDRASAASNEAEFLNTLA